MPLVAYFCIMKIFLAQQNYHIGNFESNTQKIICAIEEAKKQGGDIIIFSELCVCGYPPRDFLEFDDFIKKCYAAIDQIKQHADTIAVIVGGPERNHVKEGKDLFNAAFFLYNKEIKAIAHKTCLPTYDVFDEYRYFEPAYNWNIIEFKGKRLAVTICEDIWNLGNNPLYRICPMDELIKQAPDFMVNISASPFDYTHVEDRKAIIKKNVAKYNIPMLYCNTVGSQTEIVFDGASLIFDKNANLCKAFPMFREAMEGVVLHDLKEGPMARLYSPQRSTRRYLALPIRNRSWFWPRKQASSSRTKFRPSTRCSATFTPRTRPSATTR